MKFWKIVFAVWIFIWVFFFTRGLVKGRFEKYSRLYGLTRDGKIDHILGERLSIFLDVCKKEIPPDNTYKIEGNLDEHDRFRYIYHLYPRVLSEDPDYLVKIYPHESIYIIRKKR